ncbi:MULTISPECIES: non-homologous end-joining DNA ligase [Rhodococcus]|uniref:non-homologous end-joining DNA ligase n=1 Tax=Rhodococcus TaxID=1827 RepID=UPI0033D7587C
MPSASTEPSPMLATLGVLPAGDGWAFEMKWDGVRAIARAGADDCRFSSRNGNDITVSYPELPGPVSLALGGREAVLDGEIVALDAKGRPSFHRLQRRMHVQRPTPALRREIPVVLYLFDVLAVDGRSTTALPYAERRAVLDDLVRPSPQVQIPPYWTDVDGAQMLDLARLHGLEGVVAKRLDSTYLPGARAPSWIKSPLRNNTEVVVVGWLPGSGSAAGGIGSLILGAHDDEGQLVYIGKVGTGFTAATRRTLRAQLDSLERTTSPLAVPAPARDTRDAHWVEPVLVGDVEFREYAGGSLRHPSWKGLRTDKSPAEVELPGKH